jgi:ubiquinone/menaquinone biosynthesis C-methylase UbiE
MNDTHAANRARWELAADNWGAMHDRRGTWRIAHRQPGAVLIEQEMDLLGEVDGLDACVLGSGDNLAVFALAGMGARVTSVDLSLKQLAMAEKRATELGLDINFVEADVVELGAREDSTCDVVYTGGHVAVWVADLDAYYREAIRILRPGGLFLVNEYHPFRRIWKDQASSLEVEFSYFDNGPHEYEASENLFDTEAGGVTQYENHWTVSQYLNAVIQQGMRLVRFEEIGDKAQGFEVPPLAGLPHMLLIAARNDREGQRAEGRGQRTA